MFSRGAAACDAILAFRFFIRSDILSSKRLIEYEMNYTKNQARTLHTETIRMTLYINECVVHVLNDNVWSRKIRYNRNQMFYQGIAPSLHDF